MNAHTRVIVVGGGYTGALAAVRLAGRARKRVDVTLLNPDGMLVQRLRLHQVAAGQDIKQYPLTRLTRHRGIEHVRGRAVGIDPARGRVEFETESGTAANLPYDRLILATGSTIDRQDVPGVAEHAHTLSDTASALRLRSDLEAAGPGTEVAVVGGGMTGIEAVTEIAAARPDLHVRLVSGTALGDWLSPVGREYLAAALARLGIEVIEDARVSEVGRDALHLADGATVPCRIAVWCGGFTGSTLAREAGIAVDGQDRVLVDELLQSVSHPQILAVGDAANLPRLRNGAVVRMTCQAGMPTGAHAADVLAAQTAGTSPDPFDFGYLHQPISLGRRDALIQWVDKADVPKSRILTGRRAAIYKNVVCRSAISGVALERRIPGLLRWPGGGEDVDADAAMEADAARG